MGTGATGLAGYLYIVERKSWACNMVIRLHTLAAISLIGFLGGAVATATYPAVESIIRGIHLLLGVTWLVSGIVGAVFSVVLVLIYAYMQGDR